MTDVFISYSRVDKAFVRQLHEALAAQKRDTWVDWEDIEYAEDWWQKICAGIEGADAFIFVITPDSARSKVCFDEIQHAVANNKRIVPVLHIDVAEKADVQRMHPAISRHNWLPFHETDHFDTSFAELLKTVDTDPAHVKPHTRLLVRAREWADRGRLGSLLLRGDDLRAAESWLTAGLNRQPTPTDLHAEYIAASRKAETSRTRTLLAGVSTALIVTLVLAVMSFLLFRDAQYRTGVAQSIALAAQAQLDLQSDIPERAALLALEALQRYPYTPQAERALGQVVQANRLQRILQGHEVTGLGGFVTSAAWSPDGKQIVTTGQDGAAILWDAENGIVLFNSVADGGDESTYVASDVSWAPDGEHFAVGKWAGTITIFDAARHEIVSVLSGHADLVTSLAYSPDGVQLVSTSNDGTARIWDAATGRQVQVLEHPGQSVLDAAWSPDGMYIATASDDKSIRIWAVSSGKVIRTLEGHTDTVSAVAWSPDGQSIVSTSLDGTARIWDAQQGDERRILARHDGWVIQAAWSPDGLQIATVGQDGTLRIWNAANGNQVWMVKAHSILVDAVSWSPDGKRIVTASQDGTAKIWTTVDPIEELSVTGIQRMISDVAWSPDGTKFAAGGFDGDIQIWDAQSGSEIRRLPGNAIRLSWSPDGQTLAAADYDSRTIAVYNMDLPLKFFTLNTFEYNVNDVKWSPDGTQLATVGEDKTARIWDVTTRQLRVEMPGHTNFVNAVSWSPDGTRMVTADNPSRVWDAKTGKPLFVLSGYQGFIFSVVWSPDGSRIATAGSDRIIRIWDARNGNLLSAMSGDSGQIFSLSWSPNSQRMVSGSDDLTIKVWDVASGAELMTYSGHQAGIRGVAWSPDGTRILSGSWDVTARVWRAFQTTQDLFDYAQKCCVVRQLTDQEREQFGLPPAGG